ncbi:MAG: DUF7948 domain-containing protein [Planctomycetota bacterium]
MRSRPLAFVENRGQWDTPARFVARRGPMVARLEPNALVLDLNRRQGGRIEGLVVRLAFEGARAQATISGADRQPGARNFLVGRDRSRWRCGVPAYGAVFYRDVYEGIDLRVNDADGWLKYDVLVAPGANLGDVVVRCDGIEGLALRGDGALVMQTAAGPIVQEPPVTWHELPEGGRHLVECAYCLVGERSFGFDVPGRDPGLALVIDPGLEWSTFLGGSGEDWILSMSADDTGKVTVAGKTNSIDFPTTPGAYDETYNGAPSSDEAFVSRLSADGSTLLWSTHLGGAGFDWIFDHVVDDVTGVVTVVGQTSSGGFPTTPGAFDETHNGGLDAFVARLSADGTSLLWSTCLGTVSADRAVTVDLGASGLVTVAGYTSSAGFPTTPGVHDETYNGVRDVFVAQFDPAQVGQDQMLWSTFLGGSDEEGYGDGLATFPPDAALLEATLDDATGEVYMSGYTQSSNFPTTVGAFDTSYNGGSADIFVARLSADGSQLQWSTFLGASGTFDDVPAGIALDQASGLVTVAGIAKWHDFPTTPGAYDTTFNGVMDGFLARFDPSRSGPGQLVYSTVFGGSGLDVFMGMSVKADGTTDLVGLTDALIAVTPEAWDSSWNGLQDAILVSLSPLGNGAADLRYATYLGSSNHDGAWQACSVGPSDVIVAGGTLSPDFPVTPGAYDTQHDGGSPQPVDGFIVRLDRCPIDLDDSGDVGVTDFLELLADWGPCDDCDNCPADFDSDCNVGVSDFLILLARWGVCP